MKVLHVLNTGSFSGAENVAITIIKETSSEVQSAYASLDGSIRGVLAENNIEFFPMQKLDVKNLRKVIKLYRPDIIHAHDFTASIVAALAQVNIPVISHLHNNSPWIKTLCLNSLAYAVSCIRYKRILTVSDSVMDEYIFGRMLKKKTEVIGNPVNLQVIREKALLADNCEKSDIIFLGRFSAQKNPILFVDIIHELKKKKSDLRIAMVGDGELYKELKKRIEELDLSENVILYGFQKNPYGLLINSKVMCMPSGWEGFGLAAVEALALGKPVVASPVGGLVNIIDDSCGGLCNSKVEFVNTLYDMLADEKIYKEKCEGTVRRAKNFDNIQDYKNTILRVYKSCCK